MGAGGILGPAGKRREIPLEIKIDVGRCKSCEYCVSVCPKSVLGIGRQANAMGYYVAEAQAPEDCIGCAVCAIICPDAAISLSK